MAFTWASTAASADWWRRVKDCGSVRETGHPDAPHAGGEVNAVIAGRIAEKLLRAIYQVARPQAHKSDGKGRERGLGQDDHGLDERH
jgi:hypothetical protein